MNPLCDAHCLSPTHIERHRFNASTTLAEQAAHCLELAAELAASGLSFQFKGGNSLLLILDTPQRFSIDVDIATDEPRERIESCLNALVRTHGVFLRWLPRQHKTKPWLPLASYYLYFKSHFDPSPEPFIMLDAQLKRSPYKTRRAMVRCGELYSSSQEVELPLPASIIGDKLLTMGTQTLGIPIGKGKQAQRLKHVFDVSALLGMHPAFGDIRTSLLACLEHENALQHKHLSAVDVMRDTVAFCASTAAHAVKPVLDSQSSDVLRENTEGLDEFAAHLFQKGYGWERLQVDMARVAFCIAATAGSSMTATRFVDLMERSTPPPSRVAPATLTAEAKYYWDCTWEAMGRNPLG
jgi:hypothetical protein